MRRSVDLDDGALVDILSRIADARQIAQCSLVCKRWQELRWAVTGLHFDFRARSKEEVREKEDVIAAVLRRTKNRAPGCLKTLKVSLRCDEPSEATGHWLMWADSLTALWLEATVSLRWGPAVWNSVLRLDTLRGVQIVGRFYSKNLLPVVDESPFQSLRYCRFSKAINVTNLLLEALLAASPALENLSVDFFGDVSRPALTVSSASLRTLRLFGCWRDGDAFKVVLNAPRLASFVFGNLPSRSARLSIHFLSKNLSSLELFSSCELENRCDLLQSLRITGNWALENVANVFQFTPMVTVLHLGLRSTGKTRIDNFLAPLINLKRIHFYGLAMMSFVGGDMRLEALHVHLWADLDFRYAAPDISLFKAFLEVHKIPSLVVHCKEMADHETKSVKESYECWRVLFDLLLFYPSRVTLKKRSHHLLNRMRGMELKRWQELRFGFYRALMGQPPLRTLEFRDTVLTTEDLWKLEPDEMITQGDKTLPQAQMSLDLAIAPLLRLKALHLDCASSKLL
ncbi:hypothetical protein SELMODRAFT_417513 [Selaginella moellendorffii]|uniref:F-box domain-containing protein n=1 Tax=Selaginella moellendorffii TaxID=88036 RepID=D8S2H2_SELML|nr:hypothetical protein SELMODRAFT_417513 [Selaginella moellendorffii]